MTSITVALMRRYNLGNYEHAEGRIEVTLHDVTDPDKAIADAQAMLHKHLRPEAVIGKPPAGKPVAEPEVKMTPVQPMQPVAPAYPETPPKQLDDAAALRAAIRAAVEASPEKQATVISMLTAAKLARLGQADVALLRDIAEKVGAQ